MASSNDEGPEVISSSEVFVKYKDAEPEPVDIDDLDNLKDLFNLQFDVTFLKNEKGKKVLLAKKEKVRYELNCFVWTENVRR